jgi:hypothetical protein
MQPKHDKRGNTAPHTFVIRVEAMLAELHPKTGECMPRPLTAEEQQAYGLEPKAVVVINGFDRQDAIRRFKAWLASAKDVQP